MKKIITALTIVFLMGCAKQAEKSEVKGAFKLELLFEKDGCKVYRFRDAGRYVYWSNCSGSTEYSYYQSTGKSGCVKKRQSFTSK